MERDKREHKETRGTDERRGEGAEGTEEGGKRGRMIRW